MKKSFSWIYFVLIMAFLYIPILLMIVYSFNGADGKIITKWNEFSFRNYIDIFSQRGLGKAVLNSLAIGLLSSLGACVLGTLASLGINNLRKSRGLVMNISNLPIINPEIVTGVSLSLVFAALFGGTIGKGFHTVLLAHIVFNTPYVILSVLPRLRRMDKNLYEAALDLGCRPGQALWRVVMPELFPSILSGFLIAFTYSIDDFVITHYTAGDVFQTLSTLIYARSNKGPQDWMLAMSGLIFIAVLLVLVVMNVHEIRLEKRESKNLSR